MKPTASYKMSKPTKTMLALGAFRDAHDRNAWKRAMIGAELAAEHARRTAGKRSKDDSKE
jgi:hypothetical protein